MSQFDKGLRFPEQITPALRKLLSLTINEVLPLATVFAAAGHQVGETPQDRAAFVRFQLVRLAVNYPEFLEPVRDDLSIRVAPFASASEGLKK